MRRAFLILHGLSGSGPEHWQRWLAARLDDVRFPDLPDPDQPDPAAWNEALHDELAKLEGDERVVICHSLACITWLNAHLERPVDRVLLVAPPAAESGVDEILPFFPVTATRDSIALAANSTRLVCSDDDPYCPGGAVSRYAEPLGIPYDLHPGRGHLNVDAGLGPWPAVEAWAQGAKNGVET